MKILIIAATRMEIQPLLRWKKKFRHHRLEFLVTGAGIASTAFELGKLHGKKYDLVIQAGIAGSFRKDLYPGTVVNVIKDSFSDFGAEDGSRFLPADSIGLTGTIRPRPKLYRHNRLNHLPKVSSVTVNTVHGEPGSIRKARKQFKPDIESMEGAAFFMAAKQNGWTCLQIRSISNYVERRNRKNWQIPVAVANLNLSLINLMERL